MPEGLIAMPMSERKSHFLDVKTSLLEDLSLGDEVVVTLRGKVTELRAPRTLEFGDETERIPGSIEIKEDSIKVRKDDTSAIDDLMDEEDD